MRLAGLSAKEWSVRVSVPPKADPPLAEKARKQKGSHGLAPPAGWPGRSARLVWRRRARAFVINLVHPRRKVAGVSSASRHTLIFSNTHGQAKGIAACPPQEGRLALFTVHYSLFTIHYSLPLAPSPPRPLVPRRPLSISGSPISPRRR